MRTIQPLRGGDAPAHAAHCSCCGYTFRSSEIGRHLTEAHLGGREAEMLHLRKGARLLALAYQMDNEVGTPVSEEEIARYSFDMAAWALAEESRQKAFMGDGEFYPEGVLP